MPVEKESEHDELRRLTLDDWNSALYRHFFAVPPKVPAAPLVRLYVTAEDLRAACSFACPAGDARSAFIGTIRRTVGASSLPVDASKRRKHWNPESRLIPPFLSHLILTCMVANDLSEELRWTGNFRTRLSQVLGTLSQPQLEPLRLLWEDLAGWSVRQNLAGTGCRQLRLPQIPNSGHHSIIGYSIRLAIPSRRDQAALAALLRQNDLHGREPELNSVLPVVSASIGRFGSDFADVFNDFVSALKNQPSSALFHTTFWTAVREVALSGLQKSDRELASAHIRLELEDDDGRFWLAVVSDTEICSEETNAVSLPNSRQSAFRFVLTDHNGNSLVDPLFSSNGIEQNTEKGLAGIRSAIAEGLLLFEESDDYVFVLSTGFPSSGQLRALVSDRMKPTFKRALESVGIRPEITRSAHATWSELRGLTVEDLRGLDLSRFPSLAGVRSLRLTIPPPEIKLRGGIRVGSSFVALSDALPRVEVPSAERVIVELREGEWEALEPIGDINDNWRFAPRLSPARLLGSHRLVAFASSVPMAEREVDFIKTTFTTDYKQPLDPGRWLVESTGIDTVPFSDAPNCTTQVIERRSLEQVPVPLILDQDPRPVAVVGQQTWPVALTTLLCARFASQRGVSEGELVQVVMRELGIKMSETWAVLRAWVEAGMLDVLADARWRARTYFGRTPQLVIDRRFGHYKAVLTGLVPPFLLERFDNLSSAKGITPIERRSVSEFVPPLPCCRSHRLGVLAELARELNLPPIVHVRPPEEFLSPVRTLAQQYSSTAHDSWSPYRWWDWNRRGFSENPSQRSLSGISVEWSRRDDGPDRYKLYQDGSLLWWSRSRTWTILAAFTLAGVPVFTRQSGPAIESQGDSLYLPLAAARAVAWIGPANPGPVRLADGKVAYRYTFPDERVREAVLSRFWPGSDDKRRNLSPGVAERIFEILQTGQGALIPIPAGLRSSLREFCVGHSIAELRFAPALALPQLYSLVRSVDKRVTS